MLLGHHRAIRPPGLFALYVAGYSGFRIFDEPLRVDPAAHILGLRWNLLLATAGTVIGLAWYTATQRPPHPSVEHNPLPTTAARRRRWPFRIVGR